MVFLNFLNNVGYIIIEILSKLVYTNNMARVLILPQELYYILDLGTVFYNMYVTRSSRLGEL